MKLIALGINHKTASLGLREKLVFTQTALPFALHELIKNSAANEAVLLSTCHRTEIYSQGSDAEELSDWLAERHQLAVPELKPHLYYYENEAAVRHLMRVACGLDSMILGEPQIFGQVKDAFALAEQSGVVGQSLHRLFNTVFNVGKQVRSETGINASPVSLAYNVLHLARQIFANVSLCNVLLMGAGDTIELVATHFNSQGLNQLVIANRSLENAALLAQKFRANVIPLSELNHYLSTADIVVTATASTLPIVGKGAVERALKARKHRPMLLVDLAVPRNIEPEIANLEDVYLYHLDDLENLIAENRKDREAAAAEAEALIEMRVRHFMREFQALQHSDVVRALRQRIELLSQQELARSLQKLQQGEDAEEVLRNLSHNLTQKILHKPSLRLREAASDNELDLLFVAKRLFDL